LGYPQNLFYQQQSVAAKSVAARDERGGMVDAVSARVYRLRR
jgi:hypothetical protein